MGGKYKITDDGRECTRCRKYKTWNEFYKSKSGTRGHTVKCKKCWKDSRYLSSDVGDDFGRTCSKCGVRKSWNEFYRKSTGPMGYRTACKECLTREKGFEPRKDYSEEDGRICPGCKKWYTWDSFYGRYDANIRHRSLCKTCYRVKRYGISPKRYYRLLESQGEMCAICGKFFGNDTPNIDHDHETGEVRGLLCKTCNLLLGNAKDSKEILAEAIRYLEAWEDV